MHCHICPEGKECWHFNTTVKVNNIGKRFDWQNAEHGAVVVDFIQKRSLFFPASGVIWSPWPYTSKYLPKTWRGFIFGPYAYFRHQFMIQKMQKMFLKKNFEKKFFFEKKLICEKVSSISQKMMICYKMAISGVYKNVF